MQGLPQIGEVLDGNYQIESLLGQGGFGAVYLARQLSMDRHVAIKVLVAHAMKVDEMTQRFRREVMAVRNLEHPNTIRIYDFMDRPDGLLYYAMEYVRGRTLKDIIDEGAVPVKRTVHIIRQVLKSLSEAHSLSIVHRDLKPANIMLVDLHGEKDFVKVVDFGIAKILDEAEDENSEPLTSAGVLVGTLRYMSPEQITGTGIGPHSDLYALGLIGVEMLAGQSVFEGSGRWDVLHKQISDDPVDIPPEVLALPLGQVFAKALSKKIEDRYATAEDMLAAFDAAMDGIAPAPTAPLAPLAPVAPVAPEPAPAAPSTDDATVMTELPEGVLPTPDRPVQESKPNLGHVQATFVANSGNTDQIHRDDLDLVPPKSKAPLIGVLVASLVVVIGVGGYVVFGGKTEEAKAPLVAEVKKPEEAKPEPKAVDKVDEPPPKKVAAEVPMKWIRIVTPGTEAKLYQGDAFVGTTPIRLEVAALTKYEVKAEGYVAQEIELSNESEPQVSVKLKRDHGGTVASKEQPTKTDSNAKTKAQANAGTKTKDKSKGKTKGKRKTKPASDGWVDISSSGKKKNKKKDDVPLF